ncbi:MAG: hypothetical protein R3B89_26610 [Polyangiaceae bacterium]
MQKTARLRMAGVVAAATLMFAGSAFAQDASASGQAGMTLPGTPGASATTGGSDHATMSEHIGVGYLGKRSIPFATGVDVATGALQEGSAQAPVIGVRYWLDPSLGIDAGLGFVSQGGTTTVDNGNQSRDTDDTGVTGFLLHAGVPLNLADDGHFSFQVVPELNVGFANATQSQGAGQPDIKLSGFGLDIGARAGAEIHFGFIGIPQLSLQGSVGLLFAMESRKAAVDTTPEGSVKHSTTTISTTVGDNPWNIFTSNVAAMYYF